MSDAKKSANDFIFGKSIGEGSFSTVYLAKEVNTKLEYAIKVCEKSQIRKEKKQQAIMRERQIMKILTDNPSPFFIKLCYTFHDENRLFFVMNYAKNGELLPFINKIESFGEECTRFYSAEILMALEHLHKLGIIHRDLKPENILLNERMHIQVTDFGSAMLRNPERSERSTSPNESSNSNEVNTKRKNSFVGTAHYISPELLTNKSATFSSDLWAFGCIIYQMIAGLTPFRGATEYLIFQKIIKLDYEFSDMFNEAAVSLIKNILQTDPSQRLGAKDDILNIGYASIKQHIFYTAIQNRWSNLHNENPPHISLPSNTTNDELNNDYGMLENLEPGLAERQITRLMGLALHEDFESDCRTVKKGILDITPKEMSERLKTQRERHIFNRFVQNNLILKHGFVDKKKGLFARRRMLLLTTGPHLYYVDATNMVLKGQIPWSASLRPEPKNFKTFTIHTPNRIYFLEDPDGGAPEWCRVIDEVRKATYCDTNDVNLSHNNSNECNTIPVRKISINDKKSR